ncbi:ribonuclease H-like domain-containing protein [Lentinula edodes]|uniref:ribonuclease H n=1 Tax=Lentinula lateritia TaxID=40482 RepID=A0A9W9A210_9AGAR|nr:ribonuclease H-like domain-containing protein [Lentinula edodes]
MQTPPLIFEINDSVEPLVVYCDGACKGNGKVGSVAGIGVWWGHNDSRNLAERCPGEQTNNRAELIAICRVLETTRFQKGPLTIKTDSKYSIKCFNDWLQKWLENDWRKADGSAVKNPELIHYVAILLSSRFRIGQSVKLEYVKGHSGIEGNEGADHLANLGAMMDEEDDRDWSALREEYTKTLEKMIEERKSRQAAKKQAGSLEVIGVEQATRDLEKEPETEAVNTTTKGVPSINETKVRRVGDEADVNVKDEHIHKLPVVPFYASRRYSAGIAEPSEEDLEAFAQDLEEEENCQDVYASSFYKASQSKFVIERRYSAQVVKPSEEDLAAYADAWDEDIDVSEIE